VLGVRPLSSNLISLLTQEMEVALSLLPLEFEVQAAIHISELVEPSITP
jgi:hypothetical protein